ncbi:MAG: LCP family protein [Synergistaceae bacterium]|nr:LCP family protein [Synergistaceae bacterium]
MKVLKIITIVFLIITATVGGAAWSFIQHFRDNPLPDNRKTVSLTESGASVSSDPRTISGDPPQIREPTFSIPPLQGAINLLIIGLDDVDTVQRADAVAMVKFDQDRKFLRIMAIPRDSRVKIPGRGWDKINHAYAYGGADLLKSTVMTLINEGFDYFSVVNYDGFPRIIDLLGGIDIHVEKKLVYTDYSGKLFINIPQGPQHMNGKTALEYVRFRHDPLGDIGRVQRQQKFLAILMEKLKSPLVIPKISGLVNEAIASVNTDLSPLDAVKLAMFANSLPRERIELVMAPGRATYIDNISYWALDVQAMSMMWARDIDDAPLLTDVESADLAPVSDREGIQEVLTRIGRIGILNGDGASGLGRRASQIFQKLGVDVVYTGNAKHFDYYTSNVIYPDNATERDKEAAEALAKLCGIGNRALIRRDGTATMVCLVLGHDREAVFKRLESVSF